MIDFHSHLFSRPFFDALAAQAPGEDPPDARLEKLSRATGIELPSPELDRHVSRWLGMLDEHGVEHLVTFASLPEEAPAVAEAIGLARGRFTGFALVNPQTEGAAGRTRELLRERGFRGILMFPCMHRFDPGGDRAAEVLAEVDQVSGFCVVHCGLLQVKLRDLLGFERAYDFSFADPLLLARSADRFRRVRFVIPHFGAGMFRETLMLGTLCENVYVDTSSSNSWIATQPASLTLADVFARAASVFTPRRILFGTDSSTLPRGFRTDILKDQLVAMEKAGLDPADRQRILDGNARELLEL